MLRRSLKRRWVKLDAALAVIFSAVATSALETTPPPLIDSESY
jgi:hypothetical protein